MALTPAQNEALIREVDDAVRQDDLTSFWRNYGKLLIGAVVAGLLAFGGWLLWQNHRQQQAGETGEQLSIMMKSAQSMTLDQAAYDKVVASGIPGYRASAAIMKAALAAAKGDAKDANQSFEALAADEKAPPAMRELALLRKTALDFDTMKPDAVVAALKPLAVAGAPWHGSAGELTALAQLKAGRKAEAGATFASITRDKMVPANIRLRAGQMAGMLGVDAATIATVDDMETAPANAQ